MMNTFEIRPLRVRRLAGVVVLLALTWLAGCSGLLPRTAAPPSFYALDMAWPAANGSRPLSAGSSGHGAAGAPTLIINPPQAAAGYDSAHIIYSREPQHLEYFARSEWVDTPARMLAPQLLTALGADGAFAAVVMTPSAAAGDIRLDTEILRLQQEFDGPQSRVRFRLRATLLDNHTRQVLAVGEFEQAVAASTADTYGGVQAASRAVQAALLALVQFSAGVSERWQAAQAQAKAQAPTSATRQSAQSGAAARP